MRSSWISGAVMGAFVVSCGLVAQAAELSGTLRDVGGVGIAGLQARLWAANGKGWVIVTETLADASGAYAFSGVAAGAYRLDARMPPGFAGNYGDRWYDVAAPVGSGYVPADADVLDVGPDAVLAGLDITLEILGGLDGQLLAPDATPVVGAAVRLEQISDRRIHHNDVTQGPADVSNPRWGRFYMRGMVPASDYRFLAHHPSGLYATLVSAPPYAIVSDANADIGALTLVALPADPYEPNDTQDAANAGIDSSVFRSSPPGELVTTGAFVGPIGDVDWYCFDALAGDRFIASTSTPLELEDGSIVASPFVDTTLGFWDVAAASWIVTNDDADLTTWSSRLDSQPLVSDGRYCVVVSTYGDMTLSGASQVSGGAYALRVAMGNRPPTLAGTYLGAAVPTPPDAVSVGEGDAISITWAFADPDGDAVGSSYSLVDNSGAEVTDAAWSSSAGGLVLSWTPGSVAATKSPYEARVEVHDAEFTVERPVLITVASVNEPPTVPQLIAPANASFIPTTTATLVIANSTDPDGDVLTYEVELYADASTGTPIATQSLVEGTGGETTWEVSGLEDGRSYFWRARAYDGQSTSAYSAWGGPWAFGVSLVNQPPTAPVLTKPAVGELVLVRSPTLSVLNPTDPEGDPIFIFFQVARDAAFTDIVASSSGVALDTHATSTTWQVAPALNWGATYYARAYALDQSAARSDPSEVHRFELKTDTPPDAPSLPAPFVGACDGSQALDVLPSVLTVAATDTDGDPLEVTASFFLVGDGDVASFEARAVVDGTRGEADVSLTGAALADGVYRLEVSSSDGIATSATTSCLFTLGDASSTGGVEKKGCACSGANGSASPLGWIGVVTGVVLMRRRRRRVAL